MIAVKGMLMPDTCRRCLFLRRIELKQEVHWCGVTGVCVNPEIKSVLCPLIEVDDGIVEVLMDDGK